MEERGESNSETRKKEASAGCEKKKKKGGELTCQECCLDNHLPMITDLNVNE